MSAHESVRIIPETRPVSPIRPDGGGLRDVFRIAFPLICSSSAHAVKLFSDRAMVGWYSSTMLSASFLAGLLASIFIVAVIATGQYTGTFVAQYMGAGRPDRVGRAVWQGILFSLAAGVLLSALGIFGTPLLAFMGHDSELLLGEQSYFMVTLCMAGFSIGAASVAAFWTGRGKPWMATIVVLFSLFLNIVFNWIFIFGTDGCQALADTPLLRHFGAALNQSCAWIAAFLAPYAGADHGGLNGVLAPLGWILNWLAVEWGGRPMGIFGAAFATGLTEAMTFLIFLAFFLTPHNRRAFGAWPKKVLDLDLMRRLLRFGMPAGAQPFVDILTFFCFNYLLHEYGAVAGHAAAIAFSVNTLAFNPMLGMGAAATILVGQAVGGRHIGLAKRVVRSTRRMIVAYVMVMSFLFLGYPDKIIAFFAEDKKPAAVEAVEAVESPDASAIAPNAAAPVDAVDVDTDDAVDAAAGASQRPADAPRENTRRTPGVKQITDPAKTNETARLFLFFIALWLIGDGFFILYSSAIRGAGDTRFAMKMIMAMSVCLYAIPCCLIHFLNDRLRLGWGPTPLWIAMVGYVMISGILFYWRYRHGAWQNMRVIED